MNPFNQDFLETTYLNDPGYLPSGTSNLDVQKSPNRNAVAQTQGSAACPQSIGHTWSQRQWLTRTQGCV